VKITGKTAGHMHRVEETKFRFFSIFDACINIWNFRASLTNYPFLILEKYKKTMWCASLVVSLLPNYWSDFDEKFFSNSPSIVEYFYVGRFFNFNPCWVVFREIDGKSRLKLRNFLPFPAMAQCHGQPLKILIPHDKGISFTPTMVLVSFEYLKNWNFASFFRVPRSDL